MYYIYGMQGQLVGKTFAIHRKYVKTVKVFSRLTFVIYGIKEEAVSGWQRETTPKLQSMHAHDQCCFSMDILF